MSWMGREPSVNGHPPHTTLYIHASTPLKFTAFSRILWFGGTIPCLPSKCGNNPTVFIYLFNLFVAVLGPESPSPTHSSEFKNQQEQLRKSKLRDLPCVMQTQVQSPEHHQKRTLSTEQRRGPKSYRGVEGSHISEDKK